MPVILWGEPGGKSPNWFVIFLIALIAGAVIYSLLQKWGVI